MPLNATVNQQSLQNAKNATAIASLAVDNHTFDLIVNSAVNGVNFTTMRFTPRYGVLHVAITSVLLSIIILCTIIGNVFVVAAILLEKNLQSVSNYLILSLAVADLMVATLVMPICALNEISSAWWLGIAICNIWTCFDVLCCTASILHLVGIAMDRYWIITDINYMRTRTSRRICFMIGCVWIVSVCISIPARFWFMTDNERLLERRKVLEFGDCSINDSKVYTIVSTIGAFYMPMLFMMLIYFRIYLAARRRIRKKNFKLQQKPLTITAAQQREKLEQKRERKAARTLAIITGCFIICWLPFFIRAIVCPFYSPLCNQFIHSAGHSFIQWMGYMNSLLNPVIYTVFSPDFRHAFSKILFARFTR